MPGLSWVVRGVDEEFMVTRQPEFFKVHAAGVRGKKNVAKEAFLEGVYEDYRTAFPGRMEQWKLSSLEFSGSEEQRKPVCIKVSIDVC
jgi:hypothetical protein